jgi:phage-related protein
MKKTYIAVRKVRDFIAAQSPECQVEYLKIVERLQQDGFLVEPFGRKLDAELFEMRIRRGRQIRVIYCYCEGDLVVGVHAFVKKSQKTPLRELRLARRTARNSREGGYNE